MVRDAEKQAPTPQNQVRRTIDYFDCYYYNIIIVVITVAVIALIDRREEQSLFFPTLQNIIIQYLQHRALFTWGPGSDLSVSEKRFSARLALRIYSAFICSAICHTRIITSYIAPDVSFLVFNVSYTFTLTKFSVKFQKTYYFFKCFRLRLSLQQ